MKESYRDGFFVFLAAVPDQSGDYNDYSITPQLFAIKGTGPPVIISQRLFNRPLINTNGFYTVDNIAPNPDGFSVEFDQHAGGPRTNLDVSWPQIETWVQEAETSAPVRVTSSGSYRLLPMKAP
jgi:hypothetical protein